MNTPLPAGFELDSPALPAGFELDGVTTPSEGFQLDGVSVNARPRPEDALNHQPGLNLQGTEPANAHSIGLLSLPMAAIEQGASALGNFVLDPRYGILNKVLQGVGLTGFPKERMEFGSPEYAQGQATPYKPLFNPKQPIITGQFANEATDPVERVVGNLLRGFTTPGSALTLGAGKILGAPKMVMGLFGGPMLEHAPESTAQAASTAGDYFGTPPEQRTIAQKDTMIEAELNEIANKVMLGGIGYGLTRPGPLVPEVLPPNQRIAPTSRQLESPTIDVESFLQSNQLPGPRGEFVVDEVGRVLDKSQLTPKEFDEFNRGPKEYHAPTKKTFSGDTPIIGDVTPQQKLNIDIAKAVAEYQRAQQPSVVPIAGLTGGKESQGGQISFSAPAGGYTIPSARQSGLVSMAEALAKVGESLPKQEAGDAASLAAGQKMIPVEGQSSGGKSGGPISEDGNVHGGAQADLPPEQRAVSEKNNSPDAWAEFRRQMEEQQKKSGSTKEQDKAEPIEDRGSAGGNLSSFGFLDPAFWKQQLGIAHEAKTDAVQLYNRVRNKLGERSASWEMLNTPEFKAYMTGVKSPSEVEKWVEGNGPKVEVRKFGEGQGPKASVENQRMNQLQHEFYDSLDEVGKQHYIDAYDRLANQLQDIGEYSPEAEAKFKSYLEKRGFVNPEQALEYAKLEIKHKDQIETDSPEGAAHWQSIAPKPESSMPGYVEIAVVKQPSESQLKTEYSKLYPGDTEFKNFDEGSRRALTQNAQQFPSSHSFPPNTLGFVRGYMEGDTFHVIEGQGDTKVAQNDSTGKFYIENAPHFRGQEWNTREEAQAALTAYEPLLKDLERKLMKVAIEHARSVGAKKIAVQDAESAMMMEGHDQIIKQAEQKLAAFNKDAARYGETPFGNATYNESSLKILQEDFGDFGAKFAIQDGKLVMTRRPYEGGMGLHYGQTLQKIAEELTGSKGEKVSFGEHKMAFEGQRDNPNDLYPEGVSKQPRKDLIFRNPRHFEGSMEEVKAKFPEIQKQYPNAAIHRESAGKWYIDSPKTDVSALAYPLERVKEHLTYAGKDAPPKVEAQTPMVRAGQQVKPGMVTGKVPEKMSQLMRAYSLPENASYAEVVKAHRERAKTLHPDRGGSADAMAHENAMFDAIEDKMIKQVVRGQREMEEGLVPAADKAIAELKDAIDAKREGKEVDKYARADAHTLEKWQLALQNAVRPFKAKGITIKLGSSETGAISLAPLKETYDEMARFAKSGWNKERASQLLDAADNQAKIHGRQQGNRIREGLKNKLDRKAVTFIIEAGKDRTILSTFARQVTSNPESLQAVRHAQANWNRLKPYADAAVAQMDRQRMIENQNGISTDEVANYIKHAYDMPRRGVLFDGGMGGSGVGTSFRKQRTYATYASAIEQGLKPLTIDAADLIESRIASGMKMVNRIKWGEALGNLKDPMDGEALVTKLVTQPKGTTVAPKGYQPREIIPGVRVAIKDGYAGIFDALTGQSDIQRSAVGRALLKGEGFVKHGLLMFDSFHASRMMQKELFLTGKISYNKGLSVLEYDLPTITRMERTGDISPEVANWVRVNKASADMLVKHGLNVGRIADAMYSEVIRKELPVMGIDVNLPGRFNKWVFDKLTRGAMIESALVEAERTAKAYPTWTTEQVASHVAKQINIYYGNLMRQGLFKSATKRDILQIAFLAPQWVESMAQNEIRSAKQLAQAPIDSALGRTVRIRTLAKGTGTSLLAYVIATQLINLYFRKHFTWDNKEKEHKLDAFIPDPTGKTPGFWLSPLSVPAEMTHDVLRYSHSKRNALEVAGQILSNKLSPISRAEETLRTQRDFSGTKLLDTKAVLKQTGKSLLPVPLPVSGAMSEMPGQGMRQLIGSLGLKVEPANRRDEEAIDRQAMSFNERVWAQKEEDRQPKESLSLEQRYGIAQRATDNEFARQKRLYERLSEESRKWLEDNHLQLRGFEPSITRSGTTVKFSKEEEARLEKMMASAYEEKFARLKLYPQINQAMLDRQLTMTRAQVMREFRRELGN